jgi:hypothetical protein
MPGADQAIDNVLASPQNVLYSEKFERFEACFAGSGDTLSAALLESKPFAHLPVLGVPGWCSANGTADFYLDAAVFRPRKPQALYVITP